MTTDVFTVHPEDLVDLAASLMEWEHIRCVPVEDAQGALVGLVSHRSMLRLLARAKREGAPSIPVRDIMSKDPITIAPEASTLSAIQLMRSQQIGSLPVVRDGKLVGIVTEHDFVELAGRLLEGWLNSGGGEAGSRSAPAQRSKR
jgi:CBS domain-containing protein